MSYLLNYTKYLPTKGSFFNEIEIKKDNKNINEVSIGIK